jgi:hypothetical protein
VDSRSNRSATVLKKLTGHSVSKMGAAGKAGSINTETKAAGKMNLRTVLMQMPHFS